MRGLLIAIRMTVVLTVLLGLIYPLALTGVARVLFPWQSAGSLVSYRRQVIGSAIIGQNFSAPQYFHSRPSAAGDKGYDASGSGGSNLGPTNKTLIDRVAGDVQKARTENPSEPVPIDLVTNSGSGLDPDISPAAAEFQVPRVAQSRNMKEEEVRALVGKHTQGRDLGFLGERRVNVLELNLDLDSQPDPR